jgi:hypothetical protein
VPARPSVDKGSRRETHEDGERADGRERAEQRLGARALARLRRSLLALPRLHAQRFALGAHALSSLGDVLV